MARSERKAAASFSGGAGDPSTLDRALGLARDWAGPDPLALFLSGSHASREAVSAEVDGRRVLLSDVDVYGLMPDPAAVAAANSRMKRARRGLREKLLGIGMAAPLEAAFFTLDQMQAMVPRPATLDLARHARVIAGEEKWKERIPRFGPRDISPEEIGLLHDNRGMELLYALAMSKHTDRLTRLQAHHATMKAGLDLAAVMCLNAGEYPDGAAARVALARGLRDQWLSEDMPWEEGVAWKLGQGELPDEAAQQEQHSRVVRGWVELWRRMRGVEPDAVPWQAVIDSARRAPLKRRWREAWTFRGAGGGPSLASRLSHAGAGTPQHRLNASAAAILLWEADPDTTDSSAFERTLTALGVVRGVAGVEAATDVVRAWDRWILGGQRTAGWS